jgi:hypothetical protein
MAILAETNLYPGVNAHLNSFLQHEAGGWQSFHAEHLGDLQRVINAALPSGYYTRAEKSLQINAAPAVPDMPIRRTNTTPDVLIYQQRGVGSSTGTAIATAIPTFIASLADLDDDEDVLMSVMIYRAAAERSGTPITRIELLSPANKRGGTHHEQYVSKRRETLKSGLCLVEIDYLHETPPISPRIPVYRRDPDANPYGIAVSDPRPSLERGQTAYYGISVLAALPTIAVPLAQPDQVVVDFNAAYHLTYDSSTFYRLIVDYAADPPAFDRYTPADQAAIRAHLDAIRQGKPS